jgi:hypothetical protein
VVKSESSTILDEVLSGQTPLLVAAKQVRHLATLVSGFRHTTAEEHVRFGAIVGPDVLFDDVVVPAINTSL